MTYRFGTFTFNDRTSLLTRAERQIGLEPQPARALALLLAKSGEVVSREELRSHLWGGDTHVDFDRGLAYCIGELRAVLGDSADNPRFVQTLPRRGFRFIAPVEKIGTGDLLTRARPRAFGRWAIGAVVLAGVAVLGTWVVVRGPLSSASRPIVAVARFENESGDPSHDRVVAGLSDALVERLTALGPSRIGVNGNAGILRRPRDARDTRAVAKETGAAFLVSGQLQTREGVLSLLVQLIRLDDGTHVWVDRIARPIGDRLETLHADVARQVENAVRRIVLKAERRAS
jgi:DNA-binding winged helix-turn-helix (wHTH) protein/TolB-like protein